MLLQGGPALVQDAEGVIVAVEFEEGDEADVLGVEVGFTAAFDRGGGVAGAEDFFVVREGGVGEEGAEGFGGGHGWKVFEMGF